MLLSHSTPEGHVAPECKPDSFLQRWRNVGLWGGGGSPPSFPWFHPAGVA